MRFGIHVSIKNSLDSAIDNAIEEKCDAFQIFTRNPRGWKFTPLESDEVKNFRIKLQESGLHPVITHMPYLPNLSCPDEEMHAKSVSSLLSEVDRCVELG